ncbi:hypothetical protein LEP1GSC198_3238 [Leptospira kirschneri str. JB]|nr:hypothetical protein LEP1GSC198_3238 [Leptospira kirschneri str. JB]
MKIVAFILAKDISIYCNSVNTSQSSGFGIFHRLLFFYSILCNGSFRNDFNHYIRNILI